MERIEGRIWVFGDDINTDVIAPGKYLKLTNEEMAAHVMEGIDPTFASKVKPGDIIVAGKNFGCGSSRESAPAALKYAGIAAVICQFSARIFYRNAINLGLPVLEVGKPVQYSEGDVVQIDLRKGTIWNENKQTMLQVEPLPDHIMEILQAGGLLPYLENKLIGTN